MKLKQIIFIIALFIIVLSCGRKGLIPKKTLTDIITEMYIADVLRETELTNTYNYKALDSISLYGYIYKKFGYTIDDFNYSISYYSEKPDVLKGIYDDVIKHLTEMQDKYAKMSAEERRNRNLWTGADSIFVDTDTIFSKFPFTIQISGKGLYKIAADINFYENDSTQNPRMVAWFTSYGTPDSIVERKEIPLSKPHWNDTLYLYLNDMNMNLIKGYFVDSDSVLLSKTVRPDSLLTNVKTDSISIDTLNIYQHILIKNVSVRYTEGDSISPTLPDTSTQILDK